MRHVKDIRVQVYAEHLPDGGHGMIIDADNGEYLMVINEDDPEDVQRTAFLHEMLHIYNDDFERVLSDGIQRIETETHEQLARLSPEA